jgi:hypothetical protein
MNTAIFVYAKDKTIKVLSVTSAKNKHKELIDDGWIHTHTLDACVFLEYLHNKCEAEDVISEVISLAKRDV